MVIDQGHVYFENLNITIDGTVAVNGGGTLGTYIYNGNTTDVYRPRLS